MKKFLLLTIIFFVFSTQAATIIIDLEGVLIEQCNSFWHIGPFNFLGLFNPISLQKSYFAILNNISCPQPMITMMHHDLVLPQSMSCWNAGFLSSAQMLESVEAELQKSKYNASKKNALQSIASFMFTPKRFSQSFRVIPAGVKFLKKCRKAGHKIYILSNFDAETFANLQARTSMKKLFKLCDGIVISGTIGLVKPDTAIFEYIFKLYGIDPDTEITIFIDDTLCNIKGAQSLGKKNLTCLLCKNKKFDTIKKYFIAENLL